VQVSSFLSSSDAVDGRQWKVQVLSAGFRIGPHRRCRVVEEGFHHYGEVNTLMTSSYTLPLKCYASTNVLSFVESSASVSCNL
jgi:hypothetical protein